MLELLFRKIAWRSASEVNEGRLALGNHRLSRVKSEFLQRRLDVTPDRRGVLVGVNPEVAEVAALPTKRDMQVDPERGFRLGRTLKRDEELVHSVRPPEGERGIV